MMINEILNKKEYNKEDIVFLLKANSEEAKLIFDKANEVKRHYIGNKTYFRGLIELSNACDKDCYYCGIRKGNSNVQRYTLSDKEVIEAAEIAIKNRFGSLAIQSGEFNTPSFTKRISRIIELINQVSNNKLGITLSLGEQTEETFATWKSLGVRRYLLRIETTNKQLYYKIHPQDDNHSFTQRLESLKLLKKLGYQTGSGVMIGLPGQTIEDLADDLIFLRDFDIDMCGMGPYVEHKDTPLYKYKDELLPLEERGFLALKMVAVLRIIMKDINIAATTAMQTIDKQGREKAIYAGANIIMPNITPGEYRNDYALYQNKPKLADKLSDYVDALVGEINRAGDEAGFDEYGDSKHFKNRIVL